jgi:hypothetical protein
MGRICLKQNVAVFCITRKRIGIEQVVIIEANPNQLYLPLKRKTD